MRIPVVVVSVCIALVMWSVGVLMGSWLFMGVLMIRLRFVVSVSSWERLSLFWRAWMVLLSVLLICGVRRVVSGWWGGFAGLMKRWLSLMRRFVIIWRVVCRTT